MYKRNISVVCTNAQCQHLFWQLLFLALKVYFDADIYATSKCISTCNRVFIRSGSDTYTYVKALRTSSTSGEDKCWYQWESHIWRPSDRVNTAIQEFQCRWWIRCPIKMYYACDFSPWLTVAMVGFFSRFLLPKIPAHHRTSSWPRQPHRCWASPPPSLSVDAPTLLSKNNLSPSFPPSSQPLCGYWMSFVCVWMSSLEKDVPQLHIVFHLPAWTETWTMHPDAFEQSKLDVRPCSRVLVKFRPQSSEVISVKSGHKYCIQ